MADDMASLEAELLAGLLDDDDDGFFSSALADKAQREEDAVRAREEHEVGVELLKKAIEDGVVREGVVETLGTTHRANYTRENLTHRDLDHDLIVSKVVDAEDDPTKLVPEAEPAIPDSSSSAADDLETALANSTVDDEATALAGEISASRRRRMERRRARKERAARMQAEADEDLQNVKDSAVLNEWKSAIGVKMAMTQTQNEQIAREEAERQAEIDRIRAEAAARPKKKVRIGTDRSQTKTQEERQAYLRRAAEDRLKGLNAEARIQEERAAAIQAEREAAARAKAEQEELERALAAEMEED